MKKYSKIAFSALAILLVLIISISLIATGCKNAKILKNDTIAKLDGQVIHVYDSDEEALENPIESDNIDRILEINGDYKVSAGFGSNIKVPSALIMQTSGDGTYTLGISKIKVKTTLLIKIYSETERTKSYQILTENKEAEKFFVAILINPTKITSDDDNLNTTVSTSSQKSLIPQPSGKIYLNKVLFNSYEDSDQSKAKAKEQLITISGEELTLSATPDDGTVRIYVKPYAVDDEVVWKNSVLLHDDNEWTDKMNVSEYSGHLLTLKIQSESNETFETGYSFISFYIPEFN